MQTLYHYRLYFDTTGNRTSGNIGNDIHFFGSYEIDGIDCFTRHIPLEKYALSIKKETAKGYKDFRGGYYKKADLDKIQITNFPGKRVNCMIDYYSFSNYVSAMEIKDKFKEYILNCFN